MAAWGTAAGYAQVSAWANANGAKQGWTPAQTQQYIANWAKGSGYVPPALSAVGGGGNASGGGGGPAVTPGGAAGLGTGGGGYGGAGSVGGPSTENDVAPSLRQGEYIGLRQDVADGEMPEYASPYTMNWDDTHRLGSLSVRDGEIATDITKLTVNPGGGTPTYSAYYGMGVDYVPPFDDSEGTNKAGFLMVAFTTNQTWNATATNVGWIVRANMMWSRARDLEGVDSLTLTVSDAGSHTLRIVVSDAGGTATNSIVALTVRYSTVGYPTAIDGEDEYSSTVASSKDRAAWTGASTGNLDTTVAAGTYYVSAWGITREGVTARASRKVVVA